MEKEKHKKINEKTTAPLKQIFSYAKCSDFVYILIGTIGSIIASGNWPALTVTFGKMVDVFVTYEHWYNNDAANATDVEAEEIRQKFMKDVFILSGATGIVCVVFIIGNFSSLYFFQLFSFRLTKNVKQKYFRSILRQELGWFDNQNSGEFASRISSDFKKFENAFNENLALLLYNISSAIIHLILGFCYGWELSLVILSIAPIMLFFAIINTKFQTHFAQRETNSNSLASSVTEEVISAIRTVFAFGGQRKEIERYELKLLPGFRYGCKRNFVTGLGVAIHWTCIYLSLSLGIWYGVRLILDPNKDYTIGQVVIVFWAITGTGFSLGYAAPFYESFRIGKSVSKSIFDVVERFSTIDSLENFGINMQEYKADIEFQDVHFNYPSRPDVKILKGLNLKINAGETVALVGPSGCGKSTTIQLIQRFYDPQSGRVLLGGKNIADLNVGWLRGQLGVVGQEPVLFDLSIEDNIRLGVPYDQMANVTQADIERAAKEANAHEFISKLPEKYKTHVGDRGTQLSGGQKQRIAIARALISKPKVLLLDEATSALDLESEQVVQSALDNASKNCTTIIIAHRLSTIMNADRIIYIDEGQVSEIGNHKTLMERKGLYYSLVNAQQIHSGLKSEIAKKKVEKKLSSLDTVVDHFTKKNGSIRRSVRRTGTFSSDIANVGIKLNQNLDICDDDELNEEDLTKAKKFPITRLMSLVWLDKCYFMVAFIMALLYGMATPIYALIFGEFVDIFAQSKDPHFLMSQTMIYTYSFICLAIGILICCTTQVTLFGIVGEKLTRRLRIMAYKAILNQEISFFDKPKNSAGALCARLVNDAANVQGATGLRVSMLCQAISTVTFSLVMGFLYNWRLSLVSLALMPVVAFASTISSALYSSQANKDSQTAEKNSKTVIEVINSIRTVMSLHKEEYFYQQFDQTLLEHYRLLRMKCFYKSMVLSLALGAPFFAYTINFSYGGYLISNGLLKSGDFFKIAESIIFGALVVGQSSVLSSDFTKAKLAAMNIFKLIDRQPINTSNNNGQCTMISTTINKQQQQQINRSKGNVSFRGVHFRYPSRPQQEILKGLSFNVHQGETVALVGSSGCGKSTSIQLLERFYNCNDGNVYLDDEDISEKNVEWLRSQMSLVQQEPILFSYSIRENIAYGDNSRQVPFEDIVRAAQMANADDFIKKLPNGYDTPVGSKGTQLSGGQKQRIAIARALVRDPPILLLDEATSALDTESEQTVQMALDEASKDRTCLVIAHRLKTIVNSDKIVVIHKGENVEEGTHQELLAKQGYYWNLYEKCVT